MHSDNAALPPLVPGPAAAPVAVLASCLVISVHAVRPLLPPAVAAVAAGVVTAAVAAGFGLAAVAAWFGLAAVVAVALAGVLDFAGPQAAKSRQPMAANKALLVLVPVMMISYCWP